MCLEMAVSCPPAGGESAPGSSLCPLGTFGRQGVLQRTRFHRAFSSVAGFGGPKLTWLRQKASSLKARLARRPSSSDSLWSYLFERLPLVDEQQIRFT
ncbi:unnamed protein product [Cuscuta campestris]|uniref:Uncharacterized protein n=1 Tax=Cuscuta campestris TaxID=132261 RepID=A0A484M6A8_9ASTE|nr:unnamed protein product [Cuscuta campestris]